MSELKCRPTPCNIFYQQKEFKNIDSFYTLKKLEWEAHREHEAAIRIQSFFRGWLIRKNLKLLNDAAIKIQSLIRGFLTRVRVQELRDELEEQRLEEERHRAATRIQRMWRGHYSRKNCFNYHKFKHIQNKNAEFSRSVRAINELESLATSSVNLFGGDGCSKNDVKNILNRLFNSNDLHEAILKLTPNRICQLLDHIDKLNENCVRKGGRPTVKCLKLAKTLKEECEKIGKKDCLDQLFPEIPDIERVIKPDKEKANRLKEAIRKLRTKVQTDSENSLAKKHHLLRTFQQPGVFSDICTHDLTPVEKKLKALKFYKRPHQCSKNFRSEIFYASQEKPDTTFTVRVRNAWEEGSEPEVTTKYNPR